MSRTLRISLPLLLCATMLFSACATKKQKAQAPPKSKYQETIEKTESKDGLITLHINDKNKLYFAIPDSIFGRDLYFLNRVIATNNTREHVSGEVSTSPFLFRFTKDKLNVYMVQPNTMDIVLPGDEIAASFEQNNLPGVLKAFPIIGTEEGKVLIEVTDFYSADERVISPIRKVQGRAAERFLQGSLDKAASVVSEAKSYPLNVEIISNLTYKLQPSETPYTLKMQRSILLLPKEPMKQRIQDNRVGYFSSFRRVFSSSRDKVDHMKLVHRWRLEPKDTAAYNRGELVEPIKPIVFYVDPAFPAKWRETIKQGIEDWNPAFEAAGFKNAVIAKDYPTDDPEFDPYDVRYNVFSYATTAIENAMGPSYVDPRSGEIICAQVIWYHNVISLLHNWRFVQTAAVDKRTHTQVFSDELMKESMRYVASHEIGHTVGLMHNMGASYAYTIENLRDPAFTQKYGTTPSIMDYARNNYVAQPGDFERGVRLTPPILGVYDIAAIQWGYKFFPGNLSPQQEKKLLDKIVVENYKDRKLHFGAQQFPISIDPSAQTEDLSNDHFTAGEMAISNLKIINKNLDKWLFEKDENYDDLSSAHQEVIVQYMRHISHIAPYIGGIYFTEARQGDQQPSIQHVEKEKQKHAIEWLARETHSYGEWLYPTTLMAKISNGIEGREKLAERFIKTFFQRSAIKRIHDFSLTGNPQAYSVGEYCTDVRKALFVASEKGAKLSEQQKLIETLAIEQMIEQSFVPEKKEKIDDMLNFSEAAFHPLALDRDRHTPCCNHDYHHNTIPENKEDISFARMTFFYAPIDIKIVAPYWRNELGEVLKRYKHNAVRSSGSDKAYFTYYIDRIEKALKGEK